MIDFQSGSHSHMLSKLTNVLFWLGVNFCWTVLKTCMRIGGNHARRGKTGNVDTLGCFSIQKHCPNLESSKVQNWWCQFPLDYTLSVRSIYNVIMRAGKFAKLHFTQKKQLFHMREEVLKDSKFPAFQQELLHCIVVVLVLLISVCSLEFCKHVLSYHSLHLHASAFIAWCIFLFSWHHI